MTTTWAIKFCGSFAPRSGVGISCSLTLCGVVNGTYKYVPLLDPIHSRGKQTTQFVAFSIFFFFFCHVYNMVLLLCVVRGESSSLSPSCNMYLYAYVHAQIQKAHRTHKYVQAQYRCRCTCSSQECLEQTQNGGGGQSSGLLPANQSARQGINIARYPSRDAPKAKLVQVVFDES